MSEADEISGLESALVDRANKLAEEYLTHGRQEHDTLLAEASQRLRNDEERATAAAKAQAERTYQQQVQAAELQLRAELDRLRLDLVNTVLGHMPARLQQLAEDEQRYLPLLHAWLREGAAAIERNELTVQSNARDLQRLRRDWDSIAQQAAPGKQLTLSDEVIDCTGGVLVASADRNIRFDNTFEGRQERLGEQLQNVIAERLAPAGGAGGN
ncbi:MAG TPA: V-type ATP synthase subunit E family protein [Gallionellaceae bacterium]